MVVPGTCLVSPGRLPVTGRARLDRPWALAMAELRLRLHDTLLGKLIPLVPRHAGQVRIYTCGPTTYDVSHVGHARAAIAPDILVRHLRGQGREVIYVRNITDVDDKILNRAAESCEEPMALSARMAKLYEEDIAALGCS